MMLLLTLLMPAGALAQTAPDRQVSPSVLTEVRLLENRFEVALATDCDPQRCFSKGCAYVAHDVADQPRQSSLPGLGQDLGPGSGLTQEYLTQARCAFAYEDSVAARDIPALSGRLAAKLSRGWLVVSVEGERLQPLPPYLQEPPPEPEPDEPELEPEPEPEEAPPLEEEWSLGLAAKQLWSSLLPHFFWMVGVLLVTLAGAVLIWAWRRVGQRSIEEQLLLGELGSADEDAEAPDGAETEDSALDDAAYVERESAAWRLRLEAMDPDAPDAEIQALLAALLRFGDLPLLARAVLEFPDTLPAAFPEGGAFATAKLELAEYLKTVDTEDLPEADDFYRALNRHALSATLSAQRDAQLLASLHDEFGASGLAGLIRTLPDRAGALIFALASATDQREIVRLLEPVRVARMCEMLLYSNRMDPSETANLFGVVSAAREGTPLPPQPAATVTDRGVVFDAVGALSVLLEALHPSRRARVFGVALAHFQGSLPSWHHDIFVSDMLLVLQREPRVDLMLDVDAEALAAWLSLLDHDTRTRLLADVPPALHNALRASSTTSSPERQLALARLGRQALARGFSTQLARAGTSFEAVVAPQGGGEA